MSFGSEKINEEKNNSFSYCSASFYLYLNLILVEYIIKDGIFDHEYSMLINKKRNFELNVTNDNFFCRQLYIYDDEIELPEESFKERILIPERRENFERCNQSERETKNIKIENKDEDEEETNDDIIKTII